jgi:DNase/tRNase domain of colicin-like bacteriocin
MAKKRPKSSKKSLLFVLLGISVLLYLFAPPKSNNTPDLPTLPPTSLAPSIPSDSELKVEQLSSRNQSLEGKLHATTGVPYERVVTLGPQGHYISVVVPKFEYFFSITLPEQLYLASDAKQFAYANSQLKSAIEKEVDLRQKFSQAQLDQIAAGKRPAGYTWHHDAPLGLLLLVESTIHAKSGHTGGRSIWGGGAEHR